MQTNFWCVAMLAGTMSIAGTVMGAENNSSQAPLILHISHLPQLHDDAATIQEDNQLTFNPYAQVTPGTGQSTITASLVDAPAHGAVTMNADGTRTCSQTEPVLLSFRIA